jgi:hypothetical protein
MIHRFRDILDVLHTLHDHELEDLKTRCAKILDHRYEERMHRESDAIYKQIHQARRMEMLRETIERMAAQRAARRTKIAS